MQCGWQRGFQSRRSPRDIVGDCSKGTFACLRLTNRDARLSGELIQCLTGVTVKYTATRDDHRSAGSLIFSTARARICRSARGRNQPNSLLKQFHGKIKGFRLCTSCGKDRVTALVSTGKLTPVKLQAGGNQLFRSVDAIPITRNRFEAIINTDILGIGRLQLL